MKASRYVVARATDIAEGDRLIVDVDGRSVGVFNVGGRFYAFLNRCPHMGAELCRGDVVGLLESDTPGEYRLDLEHRFLTCPWHGWEFDIATGQSWYDPRKMRARALQVQVASGELVAGDLASGEAAPPGEGEFVDPVTHRVKGPYRAEVVPVTVEEEYVVVSFERGGET